MNPIQALIEIVGPVFLVVGFGYAAAKLHWFNEAGVEALMKFTQNFAIPCLLFQAVANLDLSTTFDLALLASFYTGAITGFTLGLFGVRVLFGRSWEDSVAIGFCCLFSNSVLLGLPITERAFGTAALTHNFAIIAVHAPICYILGVTVMELVKSDRKPGLTVAMDITKSMSRNALVIGLTLGFALNLSGFALPQMADDAVKLLSQAALPAALFGLGGVLVRYRPAGDMRIILYICAISLIIHPLLVWGMGTTLELSQEQFRSAVLTAAMAPGINVYIFANMYGRARRVAASAVLIATGLTIFTASFWIWLLP